MVNEELIIALRILTSKDVDNDIHNLCYDAANALERADANIERLEKDIYFTEQARDSYIELWHDAEQERDQLQAELDAYKKHGIEPCDCLAILSYKEETERTQADLSEMIRRYGELQAKLDALKNSNLIDADKLIVKIRENGIRGEGWSNTEREDNVIDIIEEMPVITLTK